MLDKLIKESESILSRIDLQKDVDNLFIRWDIMLNIYLDNCCFNRPFDDQTQLRIHLESEAVKAIITLCEQGQWRLLGSQVNVFEIEQTPDESRRKALELMLSAAQHIIPLTPEIIQRAKLFESSGIQAFDAMHLACAELLLSKR